MKATDSTIQQLYLVQELDVAVGIIESGLAELQRSRPYHTKHFVFMTLLSSGIERMIRVLLHLHALKETGKPLIKEEVKKRGLSTAWRGHDLIRLCEEISLVCLTQDYLGRQVAIQDQEFMQNDDLLKDTLQLLSDFAERDRYVFMDGIADTNVTTDWPNRRWEVLESRTMQQGEYMQLILENKYDVAKAHSNHTLIVCFERFLRALSRFFVLADLGVQARSVGVVVSHFWHLSDDDLGKTDYLTIK